LQRHAASGYWSSKDNPAEQLSVKALLDHNDIDVAVATTGADALAAAIEQPFDCMVLDLRLPDMTGFEVLECLRDTPSLAELPVVVFTGKELSSEEALACACWRAVSS